MRKKAAFLCGFAGVSGAMGALIRWIQLGRIVDENGLVKRSDALSVMLVVLLLAAAIGLAYLTLTLYRHKAPTGFREALTSPDFFYPLTGFALALVMAAAAVMFFFDAPEAESPLLLRILALLALCAAACMPFLTIRPRSADFSGHLGLAGVVPVLFFCFWLIVSYKEHSSNPSTWVFAVEILAICSAIFSFFLAAGFIFGKSRTFLTLYFSLICAVLCIVTLADDHPLAEHLVFIAVASASLLRAAVIIRNLQQHRKD